MKPKELIEHLREVEDEDIEIVVVWFERTVKFVLVAPSDQMPTPNSAFSVKV